MTANETVSEGDERTADAEKVTASHAIRWWSPRRIGAIYLWLVIIVIFGILEPQLFLNEQTVKGIANGYSISAIAAFAVLIPLVAGVFDVSVGATMTLSGVIVAKLLAETGLPGWTIVLIGIAAGVAVGLLNSVVVVVLRIPSLIGTLAVLGMVNAIAIGVSDNRILSAPRFSGAFSADLVSSQILGYTRPVLYALLLMIVIGLLLEQTQTGRYLYAVGFNPLASRLAGLRVSLLQTGALVLGGVLGAFAGVVLAAQVSSASPGAGAPYLLPAFAAVFLGATQFRDFRFNSWGTLVAVFMLGTGEYGLNLAGAPVWMPAIFQGLALVAAIAITQFGSRDRSGAS